MRQRALPAVNAGCVCKCFVSLLCRRQGFQYLVLHRVVPLELNLYLRLQLRDACRVQQYALAEGDDGRVPQQLVPGEELLFGLQQYYVSWCRATIEKILKIL